MKIAVVTDGGRTISHHFGRACCYLVFTIDKGEIIAEEQREKSGHQQFAHEHHDDHTHEHEHGHGFGMHSAAKHARMIEPIRDCDTVIVRGMGRGAYLAVQQASIRPIVTELKDAEEAVRAFIDGTLVDRPERLH
jgi:predicted Fe-Mo cluster-binding NifX family protein